MGTVLTGVTKQSRLIIGIDGITNEGELFNQGNVQIRDQVIVSSEGITNENGYWGFGIVSCNGLTFMDSTSNLYGGSLEPKLDGTDYELYFTDPQGNDVQITSDGSVSIANDTITLAMMAHGTDGNLITYDTAGAPAAVATGSATEVLTSNGAGAAPTFQAAGGGGAKSMFMLTPGAAALPNSSFAELEKESGTNWVYYMAKFDAAADENIYFTKCIPEDYAGGSIKITLYWKANAVAGTALMKVVVRSPNDDEVWDATGTPSTVETAIDCLADGAADDLIIDSGTWSSTLPTAGDALQIRIYRDADASGGGTDDLSVDLELLQVLFEEV